MSANVTGRCAIATLPTTPTVERMNPPARSRLQNRQPRWSEAEPVRREALRCIPGSAGKAWRNVLGSNGLPDAERLREQEHARKPVARSRYQGRRAGRPA